MSSDSSTESPAYDGVVFAGGGCRCFWQAGFYSATAEQLSLRPKEVAAASAGAALACVSLTGLAEKALVNFKRRATSNSKNVYAENLFRAAPVFPHAQLFRDAIGETVDDDAFATLQSGPQFHVALTRGPKSRIPLPARLFAGLVAYKLERRLRDPIHSQWPSQLGLQVEWARADECSTIEELADLLLQTSCTPPFTPAFSRDGAPVLDGGLTDNVPVAALQDCERVLVLLTRRYQVLPTDSRLHYVQPSQEIPIGAWDYTSPSAIQSAFDLGRRDGEHFASVQTR